VSDLHADISEILISEQEIEEKISMLAKQITEDYRGKDLLLVGVLKGALVFMADLCRHIDLPLEFDFMAVSSSRAATWCSSRTSSTQG
jgi:hypoxanthine phosphoribosyltransferase